MKTTVHIPDSLLEEARGIASRDNTTLKALVEEGLRKVIVERKQAKAFNLRKATFKGEGMRPHLAGASWDRIRELSYEDRGG
ncbi:MAG: type II toxin-antitoxin system VapB family antitoxin [Desulfobacterales bacterium]|nr:type II toxin-antitoxin system VapB family antitoxin [Desulfobacterales bacterium]